MTRLLHPGLLTLRGLFFGMFLRHMPPDDAAADRADDRVMPGIMTRHPAYDRAFQTTRRVRRAGHCRSECRRCEGGFDITRFHLKVPFC